jgi:hypothetical protein
MAEAETPTSIQRVIGRGGMRADLRWTVEQGATVALSDLPPFTSPSGTRELVRFLHETVDRAAEALDQQEQQNWANLPSLGLHPVAGNQLNPPIDGTVWVADPDTLTFGVPFMMWVPGHYGFARGEGSWALLLNGMPAWQHTVGRASWNDLPAVRALAATALADPESAVIEAALLYPDQVSRYTTEWNQTDAATQTAAQVTKDAHVPYTSVAKKVVARLGKNGAKIWPVRLPGSAVTCGLVIEWPPNRRSTVEEMSAALTDLGLTRLDLPEPTQRGYRNDRRSMWVKATDIAWAEGDLGGWLANRAATASAGYVLA